MNGAGNDKPTTTGFFCSEKTRLGEVSSLAIKAQPSTPAISAKLRRDRGALGGVFFGLEEASRKLSAGGGRPMDDGDVERMRGRSAWPENFCGGKLDGENDASRRFIRQIYTHERERERESSSTAASVHLPWTW